MSNRRRIGVSSATTEAARRQLMQPVTCWEKKWSTRPGSSITIYKWTKSEKAQHFSDDEGEVNEPLAPLDELEIIEGDEEDEVQLATGTVTAAAPSPTNPTEDAKTPDLHLEEESQPEPSLGLVLDPAPDSDNKVMKSPIDESNMTMGIDLSEDKLNEAGGLALDLSDLPADGIMFEDAHNLSQINADDAIMGGPMTIDQELDPFAQPE